MNTAKNIEKLNLEFKNANWDDVFVDENPDSAHDTFLILLTSSEVPNRKRHKAVDLPP